MRKHLRNQIHQLFMTLDEAHEEIRKYIDTGDVGVAIDIMAQCQEGAVAIGNGIESSEDNAHTTIKKLEKYCESLYFTAKELQSGKKVKVNNLKNDLAEAKRSFNQEIQAKIEVVFFPIRQACGILWKVFGWLPKRIIDVNAL